MRLSGYSGKLVLALCLAGWWVGSSAAKPPSLKGKEPYVRGEVLVQFKEGLQEAAKTSVLSKLGAADKTRKLPFVKVKLRVEWDVPQALSQLQKDPSVLWAQPNYRYYASACPTPADAYLTVGGANWPHVRIQAAQAWDLFPSCPPGSASVTVAVLDTGVSKNHPDLEGVPFAEGYNTFTGQDDQAVPTAGDDDYGHGTFVAGIIAAQWTSSNTENCPPGLSTNGMAGLSPGITLLRIKVLDNQGSGDTTNIVAGIQYAVANDARILNFSLGSDGIYGLPPAEKAALDQALSAGCVVVASSGNEGGQLNYPAAYPPVVAVGATNSADEVTYYSNFGVGLDLVAPGGGADGPTVTDTTCGAYPNDYRVLFAPAVDIVSGVLQCPVSADPCFLAMDPADVNFGTGAGTSASAPFVSAAAALVLSMYPSLTGPEVVERLVNNADSLNGGRGWSPDSGYGRLNVYRALLPAASATPEITQYVKTFNSPNPFRVDEQDFTNITLALSAPQAVDLVIYYGLGEVVLKRAFSAAQLNDNPVNPQFKSYYVTWDGRNGAGQKVKTGVYFYSVKTPSGTGRNKIIVVRSSQ